MSAPLILVINCGSSSLKCALLRGEEFCADALFERLGTPQASGSWTIGSEHQTGDFAGADHEKALTAGIGIFEKKLGQPLPVAAVGHRVVHGGEFFSDATLIDDDVLAKIERCRDLAPLHNPANLVGIHLARKAFPRVPHVAVFDTAFHQTLPPIAYFYAVPYDLYKKHAVRRYGFHGTSHHYVAQHAATTLGRPITELHLLTAHLGNGCSVCAVREGRSVDTSMGLTPLEGLVMGTRSGDVDPGLPEYLRRVADMTGEKVTELLNRQSGLLGVSGVSNDMRTVMQAADEGNERAALAVDLFCYRLAKGLLALAASLDRIDALVFTGGIGENSARARERTLDFLKILRPKLDPAANATHGATTHQRISTSDSPLICLVIPTSEERAIAQAAASFITASNPA